MNSPLFDLKTFHHEKKKVHIRLMYVDHIKDKFGLIFNRFANKWSKLNNKVLWTQSTWNMQSNFSK